MSQWQFIDTTLALKHPSVLPSNRGLYVRDWRGVTELLNDSDRCLSVDCWEPVRNRRDILHPGVWWVLPGLNDASQDRLPWRPATPRECYETCKRFPDAAEWWSA